MWPPTWASTSEIILPQSTPRMETPPSEDVLTIYHNVDLNKSLLLSIFRSNRTSTVRVDGESSDHYLLSNVIGNGAIEFPEVKMPAEVEVNSPI